MAFGSSEAVLSDLGVPRPKKKLFLSSEESRLRQETYSLFDRILNTLRDVITANYSAALLALQRCNCSDGGGSQTDIVARVHTTATKICIALRQLRMTGNARAVTSVSGNSYHFPDCVHRAMSRPCLDHNCLDWMSRLHHGVRLGYITFRWLRPRKLHTTQRVGRGIWRRSIAFPAQVSYITLHYS